MKTLLIILIFSLLTAITVSGQVYDLSSNTEGIYVNSYESTKVKQTEFITFESQKDMLYVLNCSTDNALIKLEGTAINDSIKFIGTGDSMLITIKPINENKKGKAALVIHYISKGG